MVGDATQPPTLLFVSTSAVDQRVLEVAGSWYTGVNQDNFYHMIRNFVVDMRQVFICLSVSLSLSLAVFFC